MRNLPVPLRAAAVLAVAVLASGCARGGETPAPRATSAAPLRTTPPPVRTIVVSGPTFPAGHTATFAAQAGVALRLRVSQPRMATSRLSSSYGHPPQHGHYVSFTVTVTNTGTRPVDISTSYFFVRIPGQGKVTVNDGNAPYSGASAQLDNTQLDPGQTDRGPLTFDVARVHGKLVFAPDRRPAITWLF
jgi:Domain of unknown function (DUF4352)